jgi:hypothetical protein
MVRRNRTRNDDLGDAIQLGAMLRPILEQGASRLAPGAREELRSRVLAAERYLAEKSRPLSERLAVAEHELARCASLGAPWALAHARIQEIRAPGNAVGAREEHAATLVLGLVLAALAGADGRGRAA